MHVTIFDKSVTDANQKGTVQVGTFKSFAAQFKAPVYHATKNGSYFVRGALLDGRRLNNNLVGCGVVIIDGDKQIIDDVIYPGVPSPKLAHDVLKNLNLNHFIYTSFSNGTKLDEDQRIYKWRIVVEVSEKFDFIEQQVADIEFYLQSLVKTHVNYLLEELAKHGVRIYPSKENYTLSQPWFFPRLEFDKSYYDDINYPYEYYSYFTGDALSLLPDESYYSQELPKVIEYGSYDASLKSIKMGNTFHVEVRNVIYGKVQDGVARSHILSDMRYFLENSDAREPSHPGHEKWLREMDTLEKQVDEAFAKFKTVELDDVELFNDEYTLYTRHDWPSGFIGTFAREIWERMVFPNKEIAIIAARHVVAVFCGRKPSFDGMKIELANLLIAPQGVGKDTPNKVLSHVVNGALDGLLTQFEAEALQFFEGSKGSYGVKAIVTTMMKAPSISVLIPEAGINNASKSGDRASLDSFFLQNFAGAAYSLVYVQDFASKLPPVYGTVQVRLEESTLTSYRSNFDAQFKNSGNFARRMIHFVDHRPDGMRKTDDDFSDEIKRGLAKLIKAALYGENMNYQDPTGTHSGCSLLKLPKSLQMKFILDQDASEYMAVKYADQVNTRQNTNKADVEGMGWALDVRRYEKLKKEALLYAYSEYIISQDLIDEGFFKNEIKKGKLLVTMSHIKEAERYTEECDRAIEANEELYEGGFSTLTKEILKWSNEAILNSDSYNKAHPPAMRSDRVISARYMLNSTRRIKSVIQSIMGTTYEKTEMEVLTRALKNGAELGYWEIVSQQEKRERYNINNSSAMYVRIITNIGYK